MPNPVINTEMENCSGNKVSLLLLSQVTQIEASQDTNDLAISEVKHARKPNGNRTPSLTSLLITVVRLCIYCQHLYLKLI